MGTTGWPRGSAAPRGHSRLAEPEHRQRVARPRPLGAARAAGTGSRLRRSRGAPRAGQRARSGKLAQLVGEEREVEQAKLDLVAALVTVAVEPHHLPAAEREPHVERLARL